MLAVQGARYLFNDLMFDFERIIGWYARIIGVEYCTSPFISSKNGVYAQVEISSSLNLKIINFSHAIEMVISLSVLRHFNNV